MTTLHHNAAEANITRLNAFLDQFAEAIDPDFDDASEALECQLAEFRLVVNQH